MKSNRDVLEEMNRRNGVSEPDRQVVRDLFLECSYKPLERVISQYIAAMDQDRDPSWLEARPYRPGIRYGRVPKHPDVQVELMGVGGLFACLNTLYQAHKHPGPSCIATNPHDVWNFAAWTLHPEEDMDQRLVSMYRTRSLLGSEIRKLIGFDKAPDHPAFRSFKLDYPKILDLYRKTPRAFSTLMETVTSYIYNELTDRDYRFAHANLRRNGATLRAIREMGLMGDQPDRDLVNPAGRLVFELPDEPVVRGKRVLKKQYGLTGEPVAPEMLRHFYGTDVPVGGMAAAGRCRPVQYAGGYFFAGFRENLFRAARDCGSVVFENSQVIDIVVDPAAEQYGVTLEDSDGAKISVVTDILLMALGGYDGLIPVDGISTLCVVITPEESYRFYPTGMGAGGNIHAVPIWSIVRREDGQFTYYHLCKATNGAAMGRHPLSPKAVARDRDFFIHLDSHLKKVIPKGSRLVWLAVTECGRPVSASQGYTLSAILPESKGFVPPGNLPVGFEARGGCGLGANTAIIPEVQEKLDRIRTRTDGEAAAGGY